MWQTKKCGTRDTREFNDRVIETIIFGVNYDIVQRKTSNIVT